MAKSPTCLRHLQRSFVNCLLLTLVHFYLFNARLFCHFVPTPPLAALPREKIDDAVRSNVAVHGESLSK
jgi:hypothetical protein